MNEEQKKDQGVEIKKNASFSDSIENISENNDGKGCCSDKNSCDIRCKPTKNEESSCSCGGNC